MAFITDKQQCNDCCRKYSFATSTQRFAAKYKTSLAEQVGPSVVGISVKSLVRMEGRTYNGEASDCYSLAPNAVQKILEQKMYL